MPYITAATHGVDGFYEDALQDTKNGRVILYAKRSTDAAQDVNEGALKDSFNTVDNKDNAYSNNFYPIAVTSMVEPVGIQTTLRWGQGGNLIDAFKLGIKSGMNSVTNAAAEVIKNASQGVAEVFNKFGGEGANEFANSQQRKMNMLMRKYRRKVISAASAYKNYEGSDTSINIPQLEFTFCASDFSASHMQRAYNLLSYLLPINTIKSKAEIDEDNKQNMDKMENTDKPEERTQAENNVLNSTYWMYETPPNNYINPAMGFNSSFLEGTFGLDVSGTFVPDLIPTAVTLVQSRARVLSASDYDNTGKLPHCMDEFYSSKDLQNMKLKNDVGEHKDKTNVPIVVKIFVQFEFAKHITIYDWKSMFFSYVNMNTNPYRHESGLEKLNTGQPAQFMNLDSTNMADIYGKDNLRR